MVLAQNRMTNVSGLLERIGLKALSALECNHAVFSV